MPPFTEEDLKRFRSARAESIWARHGDVKGDEDAFVVMRHAMLNLIDMEAFRRLLR